MSLRPLSQQELWNAAPLIVIPENSAIGRPHSTQFFPLSAIGATIPTHTNTQHVA